MVKLRGDRFMGNTSTQSKHQWNVKHYTQVKVSINPDTASAFKNACAASNLSMAGVLSQFMEEYTKSTTVKPGYTPDLSTRRKRRSAVHALTHQIERIINNEESYRDNIPENLQASVVFDRADQTIDTLNEALELLESAY
jgi:hypothetical protein